MIPGSRSLRGEGALGRSPVYTAAISQIPRANSATRKSSHMIYTALCFTLPSFKILSLPLRHGPAGSAAERRQPVAKAGQTALGHGLVRHQDAQAGLHIFEFA